MEYLHRYLGRIVIQASTPLAIGTGNDDLSTDSPVARDINGLPYVPATAIAGILSKRMMGSDKSLFGYQEDENGHGSEIIISEAKLEYEVDGEIRIADGVLDPAVVIRNEVLSELFGRTVRHHVRINGLGCSDNEHHGKYDNEVVLKGARFCFEVEIISSDIDVLERRIESFRQTLSAGNLRIGGGTRKGYGRIDVVSLQESILDLGAASDIELYSSKSSNLDRSSQWSGWTDFDLSGTKKTENNLVHYALHLEPRDFFLFGSGHGDDDADMTPVYEKVIIDGVRISRKRKILIPGSSVKGALAHRFVYHYNLLKKYFADDHSPLEVSEGEKARVLLFGEVNGETARAGSVFVDDNIVEDEPNAAKLLNHVTIDSFTGGAIEGNLFTESVTYSGRYLLTVSVEKDALVDADCREALERSMKDICCGALALGGGTNRGIGTFLGELKSISE